MKHVVLGIHGWITGIAISSWTIRGILAAVYKLFAMHSQVLKLHVRNPSQFCAYPSHSEELQPVWHSPPEVGTPTPTSAGLVQRENIISSQTVYYVYYEYVNVFTYKYIYVHVHAKVCIYVCVLCVCHPCIKGLRNIAGGRGSLFIASASEAP